MTKNKAAKQRAAHPDPIPEATTAVKCHHYKNVKPKNLQRTIPHSKLDACEDCNGTSDVVLSKKQLKKQQQQKEKDVHTPASESSANATIAPVPPDATDAPLTPAAAEDLPPEEPKFWICMTCGHVGCGRQAERHAMVHAKDASKHVVCIEPSELTVWCYECDEEITAEVYAEQKDYGLVEECIRIVRRAVKVREPSPIQKAKGKHSNEKPEVVHSIDVNDENQPEEGSNTAPAGQFRGLVNLGNTCFFNSIVQNLAQSKALLQSLKGSPPGGAITNGLRGVLNAMQLAGAKSISPDVLFSAIARKSPQFKGWRQQDSHELLRCLLDGVRTEEINRLKGEPQKEEPVAPASEAEEGEEEGESDDEEKRPKEAKRATGPSTFIDGVFGGVLTSTVICKFCGTPSAVDEPFFDLSIPIPTDEKEKSKASMSFNFMNDDLYRPLNRKKQRKMQKKGKKAQETEIDIQPASDEEKKKPEKEESEIDKLANAMDAVELDTDDASRARHKTISPPVQKDVVTLESCLSEFARIETLAGENKYGCLQCTKDVLEELRLKRIEANGDARSIPVPKKLVQREATKQFLIKQAPAILCIHLKRFMQTFAGTRKISKHVRVPIEFDLAPFMSDESLIKDCESTVNPEEAGPSGAGAPSLLVAEVPITPVVTPEKPGESVTASGDPAFINSVPVASQPTLLPNDPATPAVSPGASTDGPTHASAIPSECESKADMVAAAVTAEIPVASIDTEATAPTAHTSAVRYRLYGMSVHSGGMAGGHYVAYVRGNTMSSKGWRYISDTHVSMSDEKAVLGAEAYVLFYERIR